MATRFASKGQNYITVKINSDAPAADDVVEIVELIIEELVPLCVARVYSSTWIDTVVGQLVCFQCDDTDDNFGEVIKKVRRLGRGKIRYTLWRR